MHRAAPRRPHSAIRHTRRSCRRGSSSVMFTPAIKRIEHVAALRHHGEGELHARHLAAVFELVAVRGGDDDRLGALRCDDVRCLLAEECPRRARGKRGADGGANKIAAIHGVGATGFVVRRRGGMMRKHRAWMAAQACAIAALALGGCATRGHDRGRFIASRQTAERRQPLRC